MEADCSGITVIEDNEDGDGIYLLAALAKKFQKRNYDHFVCLVDGEKIECMLTQALRGPQTTSSNNRVSSIRIDKDPLGWDDDDENGGSHFLSNIDNLIRNVSQELAAKIDNRGESIIVLASFSWIWLAYGHRESIRFIHRLRSCCNNSPIILLINADLLTNLQSDQLKHSSTTWFLIANKSADHSADSSSSSVNNTDNKSSSGVSSSGGDRSIIIVNRLAVTYCKKKGHKKTEKVFIVSIKDNFDIQLTTSSPEPPITTTTNPMVDQAVVMDSTDPTKGLTFNLRLKETEEEARRNVQLPHITVRDSMKKQIQQQSVDNEKKTAATKSSGQILYTPDEADDFDDEDPDADLDI